MKIVIAGPKAAGKSSVAKHLSQLTGLSAVETDDLIEEFSARIKGRHQSCRQIYEQYGPEYFRDLEKQVTLHLQDAQWQFIVCGGSSLLNPQSRHALRKNAILIYLNADIDTIYSRMSKDGMPPWLRGEDAKKELEKNVAFRQELLEPYADIVVDTTGREPEKIASELVLHIGNELAIRGQDGNTYGDIIRITTFGESHGPAIGAVLDGVKPGYDFSIDEIQAQLNRRRPGQSDLTTPRDEKDRVEVLSGVFQGKTTGAPIAMVIFNRDHDSSKYEGLKDMFRPGHADFTFYKKYGIRDYRGGGRSSGRETAGRVMCGALALSELKNRGIKIIAHAVEIAGIKAEKCDYDQIEQNPVRCGDPQAAEKMAQEVLKAKDDNDSVGGVVKLEIHGLPAGLGDPVFLKLDARLCSAIMTLGAVKGIEIGKGFELTKLRGSQSNDQMGSQGFLSNNAGGISGGISTGQPVLLRIAVKPTSSIARPQNTVDLDGKDRSIETHGRHDPCIVPRVIPVIENMAALVVYDALCIQQRLRGTKGQ